MKCSVAIYRLFVVAWVVVGPVSAWAAITWNGELSPSDPQAWTSDHYGLVGVTTDGTVAVNDGSVLLSGGAILGNAASAMGEASVTGVGARWDIDGDMIVGRFGDGKLAIQAGGVVSNRHSYVADFDGATGEVVVTGVGSEWAATTIRVGNEGSGFLMVEAAGRVTNVTSTVGYGGIGKATVTGFGSKWINSNTLVVGDNGSGTLTIAQGGLVSARFLRIDMAFDGTGFVNMSTGGMLAIRNTTSSNDTLSTFLNRVGGTKAIRFWDDAISNWSSITNATYGEDYTLESLTDGELAGYTLMTVGQLPPLAGDYNVDGIVDAADYSMWRDSFGAPAGTLANDVDGGEIGAAQYETWKANYGSAVASNARVANNALPEPSCGLLALGGALAIVTGRREANV
jgi:T5SS/PEP-CTERM-associated repeat protein